MRPQSLTLAAVMLVCRFEQPGAQQPAAQPAPAANGSVTARSTPERTGPLLDAPVSRTGYRLGPGDVLDVAILGDLSRVYTVSVTPEGTALIPTVGFVKVLGLNLDEAEVRVRDLVVRYYRNVDVKLALSEMRSFKVFVVGDVADPGVRIASSATRVSEVVPNTNTGEVHRRNVLLRRSSGDTVVVDLVRFRQTGDLAANPLLQEGDAIVVPTVDKTVQVYGRVHFPRTYEYRPGESLAQLLSIANGSREFPSNAADTVRVTRFVDRERREFFTFSRADALGARGERFFLQPFDAVYVSAISNYKEQKTATITGQVMRPGTYPVKPDTTTVRDLVALAGGFTPDASLIDATLKRTRVGLGAEGLRELQNIPPELLTDDERRIRRIRASGDETNVVIDFPKLFAERRDVYNQPLESGDTLNIPRRRDDVVILGAVLRPGIVPFSRGHGVPRYVALAGGFSKRADRGDLVVLKPQFGTPLDAGDVDSIDPGDTIIVPFKERRTFLQRVQTVQGIVGVISSLALTAVSARVLF